ncbi:MAG: hypothetical protein JEY99_15360 [Spirochaetales bacterium]|nr:hypothetical protein [Spirochaetales bacterium]
MTFRDIQDSLNCTIIVETDNFDETEIEHIVAGDLMSEVLVAEEDQMLLVSSLTSDQVVRTAHIVDALGILLVNDKTPLSSTIKLARDFNLNLISIDMPMFEACAALDKIFQK